jgi:D-alanyl-D-alanine carboxypeptidase/RTX calcium-binding nonapeptide repeat (4 copies)
MRRAAVGLSVVLVAAISVSAAAGPGSAATCDEQGSRVLVGLEGARETTLASGSGGRLLVDGSPCGAATLSATKRIEVAGTGSGESVVVDAGRGTLGRTVIALELGAGEDSVDGARHRGRGLRVDGGAGSDSLTGGGGRDRIDGGPGDDGCEGGAGRDRLLSCMPRFEAEASAIEGRVRKRMKGRSWRAGCPVGLADLRLVKLRHWTFHRDVRDGKLVVNEDAVDDITGALRRVFEHRFPIRRMRLVDAYGASDRRSMRADNTSAFNCRFIAGRPGVWSQHAFGRAIDLNPVENPYVSGDHVSPPAGRRFANRSRDRKGMIGGRGPVVRAFRAAGWEWGGRWDGARDYQHFSANGR